MSVGPTWMAGIIMDQIGPLTYVVQVKGRRRWKRHVTIYLTVAYQSLNQRLSAPIRHQIFKMIFSFHLSHHQFPILYPNLLNQPRFHLNPKSSVPQILLKFHQHKTLYDRISLSFTISEATGSLLCLNTYVKPVCAV